MKLYDAVLEAKEFGFRYIAIDLTSCVYAYQQSPRTIPVKNDLVDGVVYIVEYETMFLGECETNIPKTQTILDIKKLTLRNVL